MLGAESSHTHRLHASSTSVVPQRDAWQTKQSIADVRHPELGELLPVYGVFRCSALHVTLPERRGDGDILQRVRLDATIIALSIHMPNTHTEHHQPYTESFYM